MEKYAYEVLLLDKALQKLKQAAVQKKFDVLLVFMFDRLGRRDDETPFIVEWFVKSGIEVWSVMEGEQRFEDHVDKLLNYIRFWQASGESLKTSIRTRARMEQLIQEHGFVGGTAPYGYQLCRMGRTNGAVAVYRRLKYICINKSSLHPCNGQRSWPKSRKRHTSIKSAGPT